MHFVKAGHLTRRYSWGTSNDMIFQDGTNFEYWLSKGTSIFSRLKTGQVSIDEAQPFDPLSSSFSHLSHTTKLFVIRAGLPPEPFCMSGSSSIFLRHGARHPLKAPLHSRLSNCKDVYQNIKRTVQPWRLPSRFSSVYCLLFMVVYD
jgi:hypothetical protein